MRGRGWLVVAGLLAGCSSHYYSSPGWVLVADDAAISATNHDNLPWCTNGDPEVYVAATTEGVTATTDPLRGLMPAWHTALLVGGARDFASGTLVDVIGACPDDVQPGTTPPRFRIGAALLHPSAATLQRGGLELTAIGGVRTLRLRFERAYTGGGGGYDYGYGYGDAVFYPYPVGDDDGSGWVADDGEPDPGDVDLPPPDDGYGDPSGDPYGDPSGDPYGDPSGDPGADDGSGGDYGGLSLPLSRVPRTPRPR